MPAPRPSQAPESWDDTLIVGAARAWSYRREVIFVGTFVLGVLLLGGGPTWQTILALIAVGGGLWLGRWPLWRWLHISRVRRQWASAVITAGAADPPPKRSRKAQELLGPKVLRAQVTPVGDILTVKVGRGRGTVESLTAHRHQLAADLDGRFNRVRAVRVEATEGASRARVIIIRRDPFQNLQPLTWPNGRADRLDMWDSIPLGVDENGDQVVVRLVEKNLLVGGEPGAGKSAVLSLIAATAALDPDCRLYLLDGKQVELAPWRISAEALVGPSITEANVLLGHLRNVMEARYQELLAEGVRKVRRGLPLHVLICDELALYLQDPDKKQRGLFAEQLRDLIARGRAAGVIVIAATQKPSVDVIPSSIRDLMALRLALRCTTSQASDTILGQGWATEGADASTVAIGQRGVGYLLAEGERPLRTRAFYLTDADIAQIAGRASAGRAETELQAMLADAAVTTVPAAPSTPSPTRTPTDPNPSHHTTASRPDEVARCLPSEGEGLTRAEWAAAAGRRQWKYLADDAAALLERGVVRQSGAGVRGSPYRYRLAANGDGDPRAHGSGGSESNA